MIEPVDIELNKPLGVLRVEWSDGHYSEYTLRYLRGFCPCAECQGHGQGTWIFVNATWPQEIADIREQGNYAIGVTWSDGHSTGIYSWEILRELCPCSACLRLQGEAHALNQMPEALR